MNIVIQHLKGIYMTTENKNIFQYSEYKEIKELLETKQIDVNQRNLYGQTRLMVEDNEEIAKLLIKNGADLNAKCSRGCNVFFYNKKISILEMIASKLTLNEMLETNKKGENALFRNEDIDLKKIIDLFKNKAKSENISEQELLKKLQTTNVFLQTALSIKNNIENIKILVETGFNINHKDVFNNNIGLNKNFINDMDSVNYLLSKNLDPITKNRLGENMLTKTENIDVFKRILNKHKADVMQMEGMELLKMFRTFDSTKRYSLSQDINLNKTNLVLLDLDKIKEQGAFNKSLIESINIFMLSASSDHKPKVIYDEPSKYDFY